MLKFLKTEIRKGKFIPRKGVPLRLNPLNLDEAQKCFKAMDLNH